MDNAHVVNNKPVVTIGLKLVKATSSKPSSKPKEIYFYVGNLKLDTTYYKILKLVKEVDYPIWILKCEIVCSKHIHEERALAAHVIIHALNR